MEFQYGPYRPGAATIESIVLPGFLQEQRAAESRVVYRGANRRTSMPSEIGVAMPFDSGTIGFLMRRFGIPVAPAVVGVILGPELETHFRRALQISRGDYSTFVTRPLALVIFLLAAVALVGPVALRAWQTRRRGRVAQSPA